MVKLHCLILAIFTLAICFKTTSAGPVGNALRHELNRTLDFDEVDTPDDGFGDLPNPYFHLQFRGLYPFDPLDPSFSNRISPHDLNCAVSKPNALYGSRYAVRSEALSPAVHQEAPAGLTADRESLAASGLAPFFSLHSLKIKPLDMPILHATLHIHAVEWRFGRKLDWSVDFPAGFHDMLYVEIDKFVDRRWEMLTELSIYVDFDNGHQTIDWEFCLDDMLLDFTRAESAEWKLMEYEKDTRLELAKLSRLS